MTKTLFVYSFQENGRLEEELVEATERLIENEKTIQKQQRDLEGFQELEERVSKMGCFMEIYIPCVEEIE